jgi:SAM-dependent methyltransferase
MADWPARSLPLLSTITPDPRWEAYAAREPYFAVLTDPKFLRANLTPDREREFFDSGEALVTLALRMIEPLAPIFTPRSVLEYGCGAGRLAIPLARRPGAVTAVDRSPTMLDVARREARRQGVTVAFETPAELAAGHKTFDLVFCYLVFQRMPQDEGLALLRELITCIDRAGIGVFHFPYRTEASGPVRALRAIRDRMPAANALANRLRGKPPDEPFMPCHTYDLEAIFAALEAASVARTSALIDHHGDPAQAIVFVRAALDAGRAPVTRERTPEPSAVARAASVVARDEQAVIDVRDLIASKSIDELNRAAEEYFASLRDWAHHLAKPFSKADETPLLLTGVATLLQGLQLTRGTTVLEFGAGTGWLSRFLTQLGCRVTLLDVSPTALRLARELYARVPVIGECHEPQFLLFDGRHIDLPDGSVERVLSFHAFHHAPNPDEVLLEFGRILRPGGIAAFAEPGPHHSLTPLSQFEMRTYGVVENNVDLDEIWRAARTCGFTDLKLAVSHQPPFHVSLAEHEDLLAGGETAARWLEATRVFLGDTRTFFLFKGGIPRIDSRTATALGCELQATVVNAPVHQREPLIIDTIVRNTGTAVWLPWDEYGGVAIGAHLYDDAGVLLNFDLHCERLTDPVRDIAVGETVQRRITLPALTAGRYLIEIDCVASGVTWFAQVNSQPVRLSITVEP